MPSSPVIQRLENGIRITLEGDFAIPFKNQKSIFVNKKTGKPFIATNPKRKKRMVRLIEILKLELLSFLRTTTAGTSTTAHLPSLIASSVPLSDSWQTIPVISVSGRKGAKPSVTIDILTI